MTLADRIIHWWFGSSGNSRSVVDCRRSAFPPIANRRCRIRQTAAMGRDAVRPEPRARLSFSRKGYHTDSGKLTENFAGEFFKNRYLEQEQSCRHMHSG